MPPMRLTRATLLAGAAGAALAAMSAVPAYAQGSVGAATEVIVITATKRAGGVDVQDAPLAVTAFGEEQLDARFVRDLEDLSFAMPNVQLNDIGTAKGIANFTIRGVGINSSIPSVDPTVGVFVDGMYLGINAGVVLDTFDLEGVEVLRGPQGLLFGRNVTGGAVLLRTSDPSTDGFTANGKVAVESGLNYYAMGTVSGPVAADGRVAVKLAAYYNEDQGWFNNQQDNNEDFGASETWIVRPAVSLDLTDSIDTTLRLEHGEIEGDGPPAQNHAVFDRDSFGFSIDFDGYANSDWDQAIWETNFRVPLGDGTITNILGWRQYFAETGNDIDSLPISTFHARTITDQNQLSNELRYSGTFEEALDVTAGVYYFQQDTQYVEERLLFASLPVLRSGALAAKNGLVLGGGVQEHTTWGAFSQFDMHLTDRLTFTTGVRYTYEDKEVQINPLAAGLALPFQTCSIELEGCGFDPLYSFIDGSDWGNVDGKLGLQFQANDDLQLYGFWTSGFRSGGYNFRVAPTLQPGFAASPGPTEPEKVDAYEIGVKYDDPNGRFRINAAGFLTEIESMQRELNLPGQLGVAQFIRNTADATLQGFEVESQFTLTDNFFISAFGGYTDASYDRVLLDLSCSGLVVCAPAAGPEDLALEIPRVAPWSYGVGFIHDLGLGSFGSLTSRLDYSFRDETPYTDNNLGMLNEVEVLDASFGYSPNEAQWVFSIYGRNLLSEATHGGNTQLPPNAFPGPIPGVPFAGPFGGPGASFAPLNKGTVIGAEAQFRF